MKCTSCGDKFDAQNGDEWCGGCQRALDVQRAINLCYNLGTPVERTRATDPACGGPTKVPSWVIDRDYNGFPIEMDDIQ